MKHVLLVAAAIACAACAGSGSSSDVTAKSAAAADTTRADTAAIEAVTSRLAAAARAGNWDAWAAEYTADPVRLPPNMPALVGKSASDAFNRASPKVSVFEGAATFVVVRGDIATATGTYKVSGPAGTDAAGKPTPAFDDDGKFMQLLMKQADGSWKIARDIWNSNLPVPDTPSATAK